MRTKLIFSLISAIFFFQPLNLHAFELPFSDYFLDEDIIHKAVLANRPQKVKKLIEQGEDIEERDENQRTPFILAVSLGYGEILSFFSKQVPKIPITTSILCQSRGS